MDVCCVGSYTNMYSNYLTDNTDIHACEVKLRGTADNNDVTLIRYYMHITHNYKIHPSFYTNKRLEETISTIINISKAINGFKKCIK